jgi:hypothetical protein
MAHKLFVPTLGVGLFALTLFGPAESQAGVVYNLYEQGNNVILEATGSFATLPTPVGTIGPCGTGIYPNIAGTCTGVFGPNQNEYAISGSPTIWSAIAYTAASSSSGNPLSINASAGRGQFDSSYTLNSAISSVAVFNNKTLADFGITSLGTLGTYTLTGTSETIVVRATPGPLPLLGAGAAFGMSRQLRRRIRLSQAIGSI